MHRITRFEGHWRDLLSHHRQDVILVAFLGIIVILLLVRPPSISSSNDTTQVIRSEIIGHEVTASSGDGHPGSSHYRIAYTLMPSIPTGTLILHDTLTPHLRVNSQDPDVHYDPGSGQVTINTFYPSFYHVQRYTPTQYRISFDVSDDVPLVLDTLTIDATLDPIERGGGTELRIRIPPFTIRDANNLSHVVIATHLDLDWANVMHIDASPNATCIPPHNSTTWAYPTPPTSFPNHTTRYLVQPTTDIPNSLSYIVEITITYDKPLFVTSPPTVEGSIGIFSGEGTRYEYRYRETVTWPSGTLFNFLR
jgi:hypothetical protein